MPTAESVTVPQFFFHSFGYLLPYQVETQKYGRKSQAGRSCIALAPPSTDFARSLDDGGQLLVWMRALAGQIEEGLQFEEATLTDSRRQLIVSLQEVMGASSDAVTTHVIGRPRRSSASCSSKTTSMSFAKASGARPGGDGNR
jgi:hypothetical protein